MSQFHVGQILNCIDRAANLSAYNYNAVSAGEMLEKHYPENMKIGFIGLQKDSDKSKYIITNKAPLCRKSCFCNGSIGVFST